MSHGPADLEALFAQFHDLFGAVFTKTRDTRSSLELSFVEAVEGCRRDVELVRLIGCRRCASRGAPEGATFRACEACAGQGGRTQTHGAFVVRVDTCEVCAGRRGTWDPVCSGCEGSGGRSTHETVVVIVPGGVADGHTIRLEGKGNDLGDGSGPGDAFLSVAVQPDDRFRRERDDLHVCVRVPDALAARGGPIDVPHPAGRLRASLEWGTQNDAKLVLRGAGAVKLGSPTVPPASGDAAYRSVDASEHRGDLIVTIELESMPRDTRTAAQREAVRCFGCGVLIAGVVIVLAILYTVLFAR